MNPDEQFLCDSGVFFEPRREPDCEGPFWDDWDPEKPGDPGPDWGYYLNMNDAFHYACADAEFVHHNDLPELARLVRRYGDDSGPLYWVAKKRGYDPVIAKNAEKVAAVRSAEAS